MSHPGNDELVDHMKDAFEAGFLAGESETYDGGKIICPDFLKQTIDKRWAEYAALQRREET